AATCPTCRHRSPKPRTAPRLLLTSRVNNDPLPSTLPETVYRPDNLSECSHGPLQGPLRPTLSRSRSDLGRTGQAVMRCGLHAGSRGGWPDLSGVSEWLYAG